MNINKTTIAYLILSFYSGFQTFSELAIFYNLKDDLKLSPAEVSRLLAITILPWSFKPLYGALSDLCHIKGLRRKPYIIISSFLTCFCYLGYVLFNNYYTVLIFLSLINFSKAFLAVISQAILVESSKSKSSNDVKSGVGQYFLIKHLGNMTGAWLRGYLIIWLSVNKVFYIAAGFSLINLVSLFFFKEEVYAFVIENNKVSIKNVDDNEEMINEDRKSLLKDNESVRLLDEYDKLGICKNSVISNNDYNVNQLENNNYFNIEDNNKINNNKKTLEKRMSNKDRLNYKNLDILNNNNNNKKLSFKNTSNNKQTNKLSYNLIINDDNSSSNPKTKTTITNYPVYKSHSLFYNKNKLQNKIISVMDYTIGKEKETDIFINKKNNANELNIINSYSSFSNKSNLKENNTNIKNSNKSNSNYNSITISIKNNSSPELKKKDIKYYNKNKANKKIIYKYRSESFNKNTNLRNIINILKQKEIYSQLIIMFVLFSVPNFWDPLLYYFTNKLKFNPIQMSYLFVSNSFGVCFSILLYMIYFKRFKNKKLITISSLCALTSNLSTLLLIHNLYHYLFFNFDSNYKESNSAAFVFSCICLISMSILWELSLMPFLSIAISLCPSKLEGTIYSVFLATYNSSTVASNLFGSLITNYLNITSDNFKNLDLLIIICSLWALCSLLLFIVLNKKFENNKLNYNRLSKETFKVNLKDNLLISDNENISSNKQYSNNKNNNSNKKTKNNNNNNNIDNYSVDSSIYYPNTNNEKDTVTELSTILS